MVGRWNYDPAGFSPASVHGSIATMGADRVILYVASDLLWSTRIKSAADALGIPSRPARTLEALRARLSDSPVRALIVDLDAEGAIDLIRAARAADRTGKTPDSPSSHPPEPPAPAPRLHILAFGPHVATALFQQARDAGADEVLARGAFDRRLPEILGGLAGVPPRPGRQDP